MRQYEYSGLVEVQGWSEVERGERLFESLVVFENYPVEEGLGEHLSGGAGLGIGKVEIEERTNYPLMLMAGPGAELIMEIVYDGRRYEEGAIRRMGGHLRVLLEAMAANPHQRLSQLSMLTEAEEHQLLVEWNDTNTAYPQQECIHQLFEEQAALRPEAVAVVFQEQEMSYGELNRRANQLAHYLRGKGVTAEVIVAILMERSMEMVVGLLGVLKAGGAYLPLDPEYPVERLSLMLREGNVEVLVRQGEVVKGDELQCREIVEVDREWERISEESEENPINEVRGENLAYLIYTSGSTGIPKGVLVTHANVARLLSSTDQYFHFNHQDVWTLFHSYAFDFSVWEIWGALSYGGRLVVVPDWVRRSPSEFYQLLCSEQVTVLNQTPSAFYQLIQWEATLKERESELRPRVVIFGGEALDARRLHSWSAAQVEPRTQLVNMYGITETTVHVTYQQVGEAEMRGEAGSVVGRHLGDLQTYVLDESLGVVPVGVSGELYVGGAGLARGYLRHPELTAERFIPDPFSTEPGARLYRTGDLMKYRAGGELEFIGRVDHQVKMRGYRIELGEIEAVLRTHASVEQAVVVARQHQQAADENNGDKQLIAYVIARQEQEAPAISELRQHLKQRLPAYMIPAHFLMLDQFPLTANGKVDRQALPERNGEAGELQSTFVESRDVVESLLKRIWEEVLGVRPISMTDDFFELGGHSILAIHLMARIKETWGHEVPIFTLYQEKTIENLARIIRQQSELSQKPVVAFRSTGSRPPFFCVHPGGGQVHCYVDLAHHLGPEQPFYALQSPAIYDGHEPFKRIEPMAACYVEALRAIQPQGPYFLGGWSLGGNVAFEMAQQLFAQGQQVALLALIDSSVIDEVDDSVNPEKVNEIELSMSLPYWRDLPASAKELGMYEQLSCLIEMGKKNKIVPADFELSHAIRFAKVLHGNFLANLKYEPKPYAGRITLIRASDPSPERPQVVVPDDPTYGWGKVAANGIEIYDVSGYHEGLMGEPHVKSLAEQLMICINKARAV
jgi:amino acid adenylation domain-containing protein